MELLVSNPFKNLNLAGHSKQKVALNILCLWIMNVVKAQRGVYQDLPWAHGNRELQMKASDRNKSDRF